jgi:hypothetical protein
MDDMQNLAAAIITNQGIMLKLKNKTLTATIVHATISAFHNNGVFSGSVNYHIDGEKYVSIDAFYNLWSQGWEPKVIVPKRRRTNGRLRKRS